MIKTLPCGGRKQNKHPAIVMAGLTEMPGKKVVDKIDGVYYSEMVKRIIGYRLPGLPMEPGCRGRKKDM
jgi:hypothetical protein